MPSEGLNRVTLAQLPKIIQDEILSNGPSAAISTVFEKALRNPTLWANVAKKLNITVTENPEEDVISYYRKSNHALLEALGNEGYVIPRVQNVFLQRRMIEDYLEANPGKIELLDKQAFLWIAAGADYAEGVRAMLEAGGADLREDARLLLFQAAERGNIEMVRTFLQFNTEVNSDQIEIAQVKGHNEILELLNEAKRKQDAKWESIFTLRHSTGRNPYNPSPEELQKLVSEKEYFIYRNEQEGKYYLVTPHSYDLLPEELFSYVRKQSKLDVNQLEKRLAGQDLGQRLDIEEVKKRVYS